MCFSATASLIAGGALSAVGVATIKKAKKKRELPLAAIPLLFGVQQLIDGAVWLSFGQPLHTFAVYGYALFAFVFWPLYIPFVLISIETNRVRREVLEALALVGFGVAAFLLYYIVSGNVFAEIVNHCVAYDAPHPYRIPLLAFYLIATAGPFLLSTKRILNAFGVVLLVSFAIAGWFYVATFSSTWCFFSALLSGILYWHVAGGSK